jgi:hypothetical protein
MTRNILPLPMQPRGHNLPDADSTEADPNAAPLKVSYRLHPKAGRLFTDQVAGRHSRGVSTPESPSGRLGMPAIAAMRYVRDQQARAGEVRLPRAPGVRCLQSLAAVSGQAVNDTASPEVCRDAAWSAHPVRRLQRVVNEQRAVARVAAVIDGDRVRGLGVTVAPERDIRCAATLEPGRACLAVLVVSGFECFSGREHPDG